MVNSNSDALGIIFPNSYDPLVPELVGERLMASIPFAGRYRMVDFILSSMANCGIDNISMIVRNNYHSLMDHLGSGREWDLVRKKGGLNIVPPSFVTILFRYYYFIPLSASPRINCFWNRIKITIIGSMIIVAAAIVVVRSCVCSVLNTTSAKGSVIFSLSFNIRSGFR